MRRFTFAALCAAIVGLGACGGSPSSPHNTSPTTPSVKMVQGHACSPSNEALQCVLPPAPKGLRLQSSPFQLRGIDAAWGAPSAAEARNRYGAHFLAGYLSHDPSKNWTKGRVEEYRRAGLGVVKVWETTAARAGQGCGAGRTDAYYAATQAADLGDTSRPIMLAIDFDASGPQVDPYFRCARNILGSRTSAYGGYYPLKYLCARGLISHAWQTYAWSGGQWLPASCAPLQQYLNDGQVDYDRAIAPDYGQWPGPASPKPASRHDLLARQRALRRVLLSFGCRRRHKAHEHLGPRCRRWYAEGDAVARALR